MKINLTNPTKEVLSGMFANVRLGSAEKIQALLVPERAIGTNQSKKFVLVVDENNTATYKEITLGEHHQGQRVIVAGVAAGAGIGAGGANNSDGPLERSASPCGTTVSSTRADDSTPGRPAPGCVPAPTR